MLEGLLQPDGSIPFPNICEVKFLSLTEDACISKMDNLQNLL